MDVRKLLRRIYAVSWLSWLELSNWTKPLVFVAYSLARPMFSLLLYAYIYIAFAVAAGYADPEKAFYLVTGTALYNYIGSGIYGVAWVIHEEREHYRILKYNYLSFPDLQLYLISRAVVHYLLGLFLAAVTLLVGLPLVGYDLELLKPNLPLLLVNALLGFAWCTALGVMVASTSLFSAEYGPLISESTGGLLFLVGSVLFPAEQLPHWLYPVVEAIPLREWMELSRYALNPSYLIDPFSTLLSQALKTAVYLAFSTVVFRVMSRLVRAKGYLEATTEH